jgi:hypothetical protein
VSDENPGESAGNADFEISRQPPAPAEPGEGPLNDPSARQHLEALGCIGALDDLKCPLPDPGERTAQLVAGVGLSAKMWRIQGQRPLTAASRPTAPSRFWMSAGR